MDITNLPRNMQKKIARRKRRILARFPPGTKAPGRPYQKAEKRLIILLREGIWHETRAGNNPNFPSQRAMSYEQMTRVSEPASNDQT